MRDESTLLIPLSQGFFATIDAEDADCVLAFSWFLGRYWSAYITVDRKRTHLGYFPTPEAAALAYDAAAREHFGPFARTNFPDHDG